MADYAIRFSCLLDMGSAINAAKALNLCDAFALQDADGDPTAVVPFVHLCTATFDLTCRWGFQYANTCSQRRPDGFGGSAHALDLATGDTIARICAGTSLGEMVSSGDPQ